LLSIPLSIPISIPLSIPLTFRYSFDLLSILLFILDVFFFPSTIGFDPVVKVHMTQICLYPSKFYIPNLLLLTHAQVPTFKFSSAFQSAVSGAVKPEAPAMTQFKQDQTTTAAQAHNINTISKKQAFISSNQENNNTNQRNAAALEKEEIEGRKH
jgi:hypothetical protein